MVDYGTPYKVNVPAVGRRAAVLGDKIEDVKEFKLLGTVLCKHGEMEEEIEESCKRLVCHRITCKRGRNISMR